MEANSHNTLRPSDLPTEALASRAELIASRTFDEGVLTPREKALIAAASAAGKGCDACTGELSRLALELGVNREELIEAVAVAQSIAYECDRGHFNSRSPSTVADAALSQWCWAQDDGCVLGSGE